MRWCQKYFFKKIKKHYFDVFPSKKHFEKQPQLHFKCRWDLNDKIGTWGIKLRNIHNWGSIMLASYPATVS